jgi:hypothetical protein
MIGAAAFPKFERGEFADFSLAAQANLALAEETKMVPRDSLPQR